MKPFHLLILILLAPVLRAEENATTGLLPPEETAGRIHQTVQAAYPIRMKQQGVTRGEAQILLEIDRKGNLTDALAIAYTHRPFAEAALEAARQWRFEPPRVGGETVGLVADVTFVFGITGVLTVERRGGETQQTGDVFKKGYTYQPHGLSKLDRIPKPIDLPAPSYPEEWAQDGRSGNVLVTFYIDETGQARIPVVEHDADEWLAAAAVGAVRQWRFEPCTFKGRPVLVRAQQVFTFDAKARGSALTRK